jgi:hypothetical protein
MTRGNWRPKRDARLGRALKVREFIAQDLEGVNARLLRAVERSKFTDRAQLFYRELRCGGNYAMSVTNVRPVRLAQKRVYWQ